MSLVLGIIATILVSKYYYKRSFKTSLTPFIQFSSLPLLGIDANVRKELVIKYGNEDIENLFEIQFLIANTGDKAVKDIIEPLTLTMPNDCKLLDANILFVRPEGRKVEINLSNDKTVIEYRFSLLNSEEFFITKLLINGIPSEKDFDFSIVSEELSPILKPIPLPFDAIETGEKRGFVWWMLLIGSLFIVLSLSILKLILDNWSKIPHFKQLPFLDFIANLGLSGFSVFICIIPSLLFMLFGVMLSIVSFTNFRFPKAKNKFVVPNNKQLLKRGRDLFYHPIHDVDQP